MIFFLSGFYLDENVQFYYTIEKVVRAVFDTDFSYPIDPSYFCTNFHFYTNMMIRMEL